MYTQVRAKTNFTTTTRDSFIDAPKFPNQMPPRIDLFEKQQNALIRSNAAHTALINSRKKAHHQRGSSTPITVV